MFQEVSGATDAACTGATVNQSVAAIFKDVATDTFLNDVAGAALSIDPNW